MQEHNIAINAVDGINWRVQELKAENKKPTILLYTKYLNEALIRADERQNELKLYYEGLERFKTLVPPLITKTSTGEYKFEYSSNDVWYHRSKKILALNFYEFFLKKICLSDGVDYAEAMKRALNMVLDDLKHK